MQVCCKFPSRFQQARTIFKRYERLNHACLRGLVGVGDKRFSNDFCRQVLLDCNLQFAILNETIRGSKMLTPCILFWNTTKKWPFWFLQCRKWAKKIRGIPKDTPLPVLRFYCQRNHQAGRYGLPCITLCLNAQPFLFGRDCVFFQGFVGCCQ